jgi:nucleotide-binding universal stress UspA family protein
MGMRIVVGVDGSDHSKRAVEWCARYAGALGADVVAVHALDQPVYALPTLAYVPIPPIDDEAREKLREVVRSDWCAPLERAGVPFRVVVEDGAPAVVILELARAEQADLVVTGRRGRGGFTELVLGSTSHSLSHHLDRPLVIVP